MPGPPFLLYLSQESVVHSDKDTILTALTILASLSFLEGSAFLDLGSLSSRLKLELDTQSRFLVTGRCADFSLGKVLPLEIKKC